VVEVKAPQLSGAGHGQERFAAVLGDGNAGPVLSQLFASGQLPFACGVTKG